MQEQTGNPNTEWYRQRLTEGKQTQRRTGVALMIVAVCFLVGGVAVILWIFPYMLAGSAPLFDQVGLFVTFLGGPLVFLYMGILQYWEGKQPVAEQEVGRFRQQERAELFKMAQGKLPWRYSWVMRLLLIVVGLLFLVPGILSLFDGRTYQASGHETLILSVTYTISGFLLLVYVLIILPIRLKQLPALSASALSRSLVVGEQTEGQPPEPNNGDERTS